MNIETKPYTVMTTKRISCFVPYADEAQAATTVSELRTSDAVGEVWLLTADGTLPPLPGCRLLPVQDFSSSETVRRMAQHADGDYALFYLKETHLSLGLFALERMVRIAEDSGAGLVYADHYRLSDGRRSEAPVIDYQPGSLRDDFDFGPLWLLRTDRLKEAAARLTAGYRYAGFYDLRLKLSQRAPLVHVNEYLYTEVEDDMRPSGERLFDYVDPRNRERQVEMEQACTEHLKEVGAYLAPQFEEPDLDAGQFEYEASVIIPVRNRVRTIGDAIRCWASAPASRSTSSWWITIRPTAPRRPSTALPTIPACCTSCPGAKTWASADAGTWRLPTHSADASAYNWTATTSMRTNKRWRSWWPPSASSAAPW